MMKFNSEIVLISDFLYSELSGGAEANDKVISEEFGIPIITCEYFNINFNKFSCRKYIISNFWLLNAAAKKFLMSRQFIIIEHDYKMYNGRIPSETAICINKDFYEAAECVIFQSNLQFNLASRAIGNSKYCIFDANLWDNDFLNSEYFKFKKANAACILLGEGIKNSDAAIDYCYSNGLEFVAIPRVERREMLSIISSYRFFVQMSSYPETYSRVAAEAKIVGCDVIVNQNVGISSSGHFKLTREEFVEHLKNRKSWLKTILFQ